MRKILSNEGDSQKRNDLRSFLKILDDKKQLLKIRKSVDPRFELAAVASKYSNSHAVLFEQVRESRMRVVSNILGKRSSFSLAIGAENETKIHSCISSALNNSIKSKTNNVNAPFKENSSKHLADLPIVTHFEKDAGPYITSSVVFAKDAERGNQNASTHRLLLLDDNHLVIRMVEGRHLHRCFLLAKDNGEDLKVSIVVGVHPVISIAAAYQAAYGADELSIANALLNGDLSLTTSSYSRLLIPSFSEIVLEGRILIDRTEEEWMVEALRTYDIKRRQPVFELDRINFRNNAILHDILPGYHEHQLLMGLPVEAKLFEGVKNVVPNTMAVHLTEGGCTWLQAVIQIRKKLEGEPKNAILAAFSSHPSLKMAIVVDDDIDLRNPHAVEYAICTRCQADKGFITIVNAKGSSLDPSSDQLNLLTTKVGIDATATLLKPKERFELAKIPGEDQINLRTYFA